jgi:phosphoribosylcarboxyaminoimidazole (NCAIR) mutase
MENKKRRVAVVFGSKSDLLYGEAGLNFLNNNRDLCEVVSVSFRSPLRHRSWLRMMNKLADSCDVIIMGAGWANHPAVLADAFLRRRKQNTTIPVVGVAFEDVENQRHSVASEFSLTEASIDIQVVYQDSSGKFFSGSEGFYRACVFGVLGDFSVIKIPEPKFEGDFSLEEIMGELVTPR